MANDLMNGHSESMAPSDFVEFIFGGRPVKVKTLSFLDLERIKDVWFGLEAADGWIANSRKYIQMVSILSGEAEAELASRCSASEALDLAQRFNDLLTKSGILRPEVEATTESPGTGTLTPPSPDLQSGESAVGTQR